MNNLQNLFTCVPDFDKIEVFDFKEIEAPDFDIFQDYLKEGELLIFEIDLQELLDFEINLNNLLD